MQLNEENSSSSSLEKENFRTIYSSAKIHKTEMKWKATLADGKKNNRNDSITMQQ
jgi:hypothetical protein